jgi:hypothetical protein
MTMPNGPEVSIVVSRAGSVRRLWRRGRPARCAVGLAAAILAAGGCSSAGAGPAGAGSAGAGPAGAARTPHPEPAGSSWHIVKRVANSPNGGFTAVVAVGQDGGWAFDGTSTPTAWQRNGPAWTQVPFPGLRDEVVIAAAASSATNVWAFTYSYQEFGKSRALRWDGRHWTVVRSFSQDIGGAVVLSPSDVWVFGSGLAALHYNGRTWTPAASGRGLEGGSGLSASDIWAFDGADVAHWNGSTWSRTSVASLLPARQLDGFDNPALTGIYEQSRHSVYAIANGYEQDANGPLAILHWNGSVWSKVAGRGLGYGSSAQLSSDGHGGLWLPTGRCCGVGYLLHYSAGHLTQAGLPSGAGLIDVNAVALIPGTAEVLGVGRATRDPNNGADIVGVILQYGT